MSVDNGRILMQNPKGLYCDLCMGGGLAKYSKQHLYVTLTPQVSFNLLNHMFPGAEQPEHQPGSIAEPSLILGPTQN